MYPITPKFAEALQRSHIVATRCEVLDTNYAILAVLNVHQGNVSVDRRSAIRRSCKVTLVDVDGQLTPETAADILHPLANNRLRLYRGIKFDDGTEELISLGVFDIFDTNIKETGSTLEIELSVFDLAKSVQRARLLDNYTVPAGERYDLAIRDLLSFRVPTLSFNFPVVSFFTPPLVFGSSGGGGGGDPWKYATEMAEAVGHELYIDTAGVVQLVPVPNPAVDPVVWDYETGELSTLLYIEKRMSKEDVFSRVVAVGQNTDLDEPVSANAIDDDINSPTYIYGPFGDVPFFLRSEHIRTVAQAQQVADAKLRQSRGVYDGLQIITTPNPAHEAGDVVSVAHPRAKIANTYVIDKLNINLSTNQSNNMTLRKVG